MNKKIKLLVYLSFSIFLTGCSVNYNLYVKEDSITESIDVYLKDDEENKTYFNTLKKIEQPAYFEMNNNTTYYYKMTEEEDKLKMNYKYKYQDPKKLQNSNAISRCYYNKSVVEAGDYITLSTSDQVTCIYKDGEKQVDQINISIITDLKVEEHNADSKKGNKYIWTITDKNYNHKPIYIKINKNLEEQRKIKAQEERTQYFIILGVVFALFSIAMIKIYRKAKRNNKFK